MVVRGIVVGGIVLLNCLYRELLTNGWPRVKEFDITGKAGKSWVLVGPEGQRRAIEVDPVGLLRHYPNRPQLPGFPGSSCLQP